MRSLSFLDAVLLLRTWQTQSVAWTLQDVQRIKQDGPKLQDVMAVLEDAEIPDRVQAPYAWVPRVSG